MPIHSTKGRPKPGTHSKNQQDRKLPKPQPFQTSFPPAWTWLIDEAIPTWVKKNYSPRETWKDKPFTQQDAHFFFKGIEGLSELLTEDRQKGIPTYLQHPKYRSGYLLYFLPLQAAKFITLFQIHSKAMEAALEHARARGVLRIADLGAGPGTASLALLAWLLGLSREQLGGADLPPIELHWFDTQRTIMEDGKGIVEQLSASFPKLRGRVSVITHVVPWWKAPQLLPGPTSLVFLGHVLNEATGPALPKSALHAASLERQAEATEMNRELPDAEDEAYEEEELSAPDEATATEWRKLWTELFEKAEGGGVLAVEPASRRTSQHLSKLRDAFFATKILNRTAASIWGPCLHAETCPLAEGRDWCHFSVPVQVPGKWFREFSKGLGSERHWLKFSYLWLSSEDHSAPMPETKLRRVISDPLGNSNEVLICEPVRPGKFRFAPLKPVYRGDLVRISESREPRPMPSHRLAPPRRKVR